MNIVSVVAARPNFVKCAAVHHAVGAYGHGMKHVLVHTGQHYDPLFSEVFFQELGLPDPAVNLGIHGGDREELIAQTDQAFGRLLPSLKPDIVLVYGDVNGAVGAAQAAAEAGVKLGHVEAGLRSFDQSMPEELNRIAMDMLADYLFVTEESGMKNLEKEHVGGRRFFVGNTMIDTLVAMKPSVLTAGLPSGIPPSFALATLHRPSNVDDPAALRFNIDFLSEIAAIHPVILPMHHRLKRSLEEFGLTESLPPWIHLLPPQPYLTFLHMLSHCSFVLTDSGGVQEEATFLSKRCFTLRRNTERPSTIDVGSNVLIDPSSERDRKTVLDYAANPLPLSIVPPPLWDGHAGERIVEVLTRMP